MERHAVANAQKMPTGNNHPHRQSTRSTSAGHTLLELQRSIGNQAIQHLIHSPYIQSKLKISTPGDPLEQEADRVANTVMRMEDSVATQKRQAGNQKDGPKTLDTSSGSSIQRLCSKCEDEQDHVQRKEKAPSSFNSTPQSSANTHVRNSGGSPLPFALRSVFEPRFGVNFQDVRVHSDARAADTASAINAKAFTVGHNIVFGHGQYAPESREGRELLAHELTHVVQQSGGGVNMDGTLQISKADQSVQRDLLDDITEKLAGAAESLAEGAESAVSTVTSEVGSVVESGVDALTSAVSTGAQTVGKVVDSAQQQLGSLAAPVTQAAEPDASAHGIQVDWNIPPALTLKAWALQHPKIFLDARGKPSSALFSQIDFPPNILLAAEELARQSRAVAGAPSPVSTPSPVSGPISEPIPTGPVSGVRPIGGPGAAGAPFGVSGIGVGVFVIFFIIGFILPFLIGYIIEHSEETSNAPDPDEKSKPGGVETPVEDAGAPTPSSKTTPKTNPKPEERDPREEKCRETFRESPNNPTHANPLECDFIPIEQVIEQGLRKPKFMLDEPDRFKFGKPRVSQKVEDADACGGGPGQTFHVPIIDKKLNSPVQDIEVSVFECACCDEEGNLGVVFESPHISGGK